MRSSSTYSRMINPKAEPRDDRGSGNVAENHSALSPEREGDQEATRGVTVSSSAIQNHAACSSGLTYPRRTRPKSRAPMNSRRRLCCGGKAEITFPAAVLGGRREQLGKPLDVEWHSTALALCGVYRTAMSSRSAAMGKCRTVRRKQGVMLGRIRPVFALSASPSKRNVTV